MFVLRLLIICKGSRPTGASEELIIMTHINEKNKVDVLSVSFDNVTLFDMQHNINQFFNTQQHQNMFIVTANPEIVYYAFHHKSYQQLINKADFVIPDGIGVVLASRILKTPLKDRVPGIELMESCLDIANYKQQKVFLLGAEDSIVQQAQHNIEQQYPNIEIASHHGYIELDDEIVAKRIQDFQPDYVFVGMGYPKQEQWIAKHQHAFNQTLFMGVGGAIEVFSGTKKRAPMLMRRLNLEWVYRLLIDWKRIGRMAVIPKYLFSVFKSQNMFKRKHV